VDGYEPVEVLGQAELRDGLAALGADWYEGEELDQRVFLYERVGYGPGQPVRHWVAYTDRNPVGRATSFVFDEVVALQHCGVRPSHRRRGIGSALTGAQLAAAVKAGARFAVLSPSPDGYCLYRHLGFTLVAGHPDRWFYFPTQTRS
jgi:GNAT superfamily N-acetyltransferase